MSAVVEPFPGERIVRRKPAERLAKRAVTSARIAELEARVQRFKRLAEDQQMAIWNIAAIANMMTRVDEIHVLGFTDEIDGGLRTILRLTAAASEQASAII